MKKAKKIISIMLSGIIAVNFMLGSALSASAVASVNNKKVSIARVWDGTSDTSWFTGDKDSYNIYTAEELAGLNELCDKAAHDDRFQGVTINLMNDIVLNDTSDYKNWDKKAPKNVWNPIGRKGTFTSKIGYCPFAGIFNGNGHTISGLYSYQKTGGLFTGNDGAAGLFECTAGAVIQNLKIEKSYIWSNSSAGVVTAFCQGSYFEMIEIEDCTVVADWTAAGLAGSTHKFMHGDIFSVVFYFTGIAASGLVTNPLIFADALNQEVTKDTLFIYCKAKNCTFDSASKYGHAAGFLGRALLPTGFHGCLTENCNFNGSKVGATVAYLETEDYINQQCYEYSSNKINGDKVALSDDSKVTTVSKETLKKSSFPKKLGEYFKYDKGNSPKIKTILDTPVDIVLNGKKANISWEKVEGATKYKVYSKKSNGKYSELSTTKKTSVTLKNITKGKSYEIMIRAYFEDGTYETIDGGKFKFKA